MVASCHLSAFLNLFILFSVWHHRFSVSFRGKIEKHNHIYNQELHPINDTVLIPQWGFFIWNEFCNFTLYCLWSLYWKWLSTYFISPLELQFLGYALLQHYSHRSYHETCIPLWIACKVSDHMNSSSMSLLITMNFSGLLARPISTGSSFQHAFFTRNFSSIHPVFIHLVFKHSLETEIRTWFLYITFLSLYTYPLESNY